METQGTPFPGKSKNLKSKTNRRTNQAPKLKPKEPPIHRQRRAFGTARNPNVQAKTEPEKPPMTMKKKPSIETSANQSQPQITPVAEKKSPAKNRARTKKKSVCFQDQIGKGDAVALQEGEAVGTQTQTPATVAVGGSGSLGKGRAPATPYRSAERCSKCRFDRLETSSYWLNQIKLAESVGKHSVTAAFFHLALESKAEPMGSLRAELKRYVGRHVHLSTEAKWRDVSVSYGLTQQVEEDGGTNIGVADEAAANV